MMAVTSTSTKVLPPGLGGRPRPRGKGIEVHWPFVVSTTIAVGLLGYILFWPNPAAGAPLPKKIQLVPGSTVIYRGQVGDVVTVLAPEGWGVPSALSNVPGFLTILGASPEAESTTFQIVDKGAGQISMASGGQKAILSIDVQ